jgi:molybdopterin converting factor small subunit
VTVRVQVKGELREHFGGDRVDLDLADGATLGDLVAAVGERWGRSLPSYLWDREAAGFRGPVVIMIDRTAVRDPKTPLRDGQDISLFKVLVGG